VLRKGDTLETFGTGRFTQGYFGSQGLFAPLVVDRGVPGRIRRQVSSNKLIPGAGHCYEFRDVEQEGGCLFVFLGFDAEFRPSFEREPVEIDGGDGRCDRCAGA